MRWYRELLASFPNDAAAAQNNFLLADLLFEDSASPRRRSSTRRPPTATPSTRRAPRPATARCSATRRCSRRRRRPSRPALQRSAVASALRFAQTFPADPRVGPVLTDAAEKLYALKDTEQAGEVAQRVVDAQAAGRRRAAPRRLDGARLQRRSTSNAFDVAEKAFAEAIKLTPEKDPARADLVERQAAAIYKQAEQARASGQNQRSGGDLRARRRRRAAALPCAPTRSTTRPRR